VIIPRSRFAFIVLVLIGAGSVMAMDAMGRPARALTLCALTGGLFGCDNEADKPGGQPSFYQSMAAPDAKVDGAMAAAMIAGYRRNNGLGAVTLDERLTRVAEAQARAMADRNKLDHRTPKALLQQLRRAGYGTGVAVENVSAGYHTLAEAFSGWRDSPPHRANMLHAGVVRVGIAAVYAPGSKYKVFWTLILAAPADGGA
jgi:uncharacterized protein YkwD